MDPSKSPPLTPPSQPSYASSRHTVAQPVRVDRALFWAFWFLKVSRLLSGRGSVSHRDGHIPVGRTTMGCSSCRGTLGKNIFIGVRTCEQTKHHSLMVHPFTLLFFILFKHFSNDCLLFFMIILNVFFIMQSIMNAVYIHICSYALAFPYMWMPFLPILTQTHITHMNPDIKLSRSHNMLI